MQLVYNFNVKDNKQTSFTCGDLESNVPVECSSILRGMAGRKDSKLKVYGGIA